MPRNSARRSAPLDPGAPSAVRLAHGDIIAYQPKDFGDTKEARDLKATHAVRSRRKDPLDELFARGSITQDEFDAAVNFGEAYERAAKGPGAINLDSAGGGAAKGLTEAQATAMATFHRLCAQLGTNEFDRKNRAAILIRVAGEGRSLSNLYPGKGRPLQAARNLLKAGLEHLVAAKRGRAVSAGA